MAHYLKKNQYNWSTCMVDKLKREKIEITNIMNKIGDVITDLQALICLRNYWAKLDFYNLNNLDEVD